MRNKNKNRFSAIMKRIRANIATNYPEINQANRFRVTGIHEAAIRTSNGFFTDYMDYDTSAKQWSFSNLWRLKSRGYNWISLNIELGNLDNGRVLWRSCPRDFSMDRLLDGVPQPQPGDFVIVDNPESFIYDAAVVYGVELKRFKLPHLNRNNALIRAYEQTAYIPFEDLILCKRRDMVRRVWSISHTWADDYDSNGYIQKLEG